MVHAPVLTLLVCDNQPWLCLGEVNGIQVDGQAVGEVLISSLVEDFVSVSFQMLGLRPSTTKA
jgi:hypothetical protein